MPKKLPQSYKGAYPFRLCTTSYIYPDAIVPNAELLAPYVDEIELLLFESHQQDCFPSDQEITDLRRLGKAHQTSFNVHLPIDIALNDGAPEARRHAADVIQHVFDITAPLSPTTYTLHLPYVEASRGPDDIQKWREHALAGMTLLMDRDIAGPRISVETLDYDLAWADPVIEAFDLRVCLDIGHLILYGFDVETICRKYAGLAAVVHLHGVKDGRDHIALDALDKETVCRILCTLKGFRETLSLEVFSYRHLAPSLAFLHECYQNGACASIRPA